MGDAAEKMVVAVEPLSHDARISIGEALSTLDGERIADALVAAVESILTPLMFAGFVVEPGNVVDLRRFVIDPGFKSGLTDTPDFGWLEPLVGVDVKNGTSLIGPALNGASQIAATMDLGDGRVSFLVIAGKYADPDDARKRLAGIAAEAGTANQVLRRVDERSADIAAMRERERLSRELHDSLSQSLWSLSMLSETAHSMTDPEDPVHSLTRQITEISLSSQEEMRSLLINLRSAEPTKETIVFALESVVAEFRASHDVEIVASIVEADLDARTIMALRRITEEALNNVGRHANATKVRVLFDTAPVLTLSIGDDGVGFDTKPVKGHLGLRIMKERAEEIDCVFDLSSTPGEGSVVTVSTHPTLARLYPAGRQPTQRPRALRQAVAPFALGLLAAVFALGSVFASRSNMSDVEQANVDLEVLTVLEQRTMVSRASADEATARVLEGIGQASEEDVSRSITERAEVISNARSVVEPLAERGTLSGEYAVFFLAALEDVTMIGPADGRLAQLYREITSMEGPALAPSVEDAEPVHSLGNLASLDRSITISLLESVVARHSMEPDAFSPPPPVSGYFDDYVSLDEWGVFGPDPSEPFRGGEVDTTIASVHETEALADLNHLVDDARLWEEEQWLLQDAAVAGAPPSTVDQLVERWTGASTEARELIDERFAEQRSDLDTTIDDNRFWVWAFRVGASVLGLGTIVATAFGVLALRRRKLELLRQTAIDPVTGIGNKSLLETKIPGLLCDPSLRHHLLITLDMDRFSLVNQVHGRAFGKRMLEVVAQGLDAMTRYSPEIHGVAVRVGFDTFYVSFHSTAELPVDLARQALRRIRSTTISADDGTLVRCDFSYGLVQAEGSPDLQSLLAACDLDLYEARSDRGRVKS